MGIFNRTPGRFASLAFQGLGILFLGALVNFAIPKLAEAATVSGIVMDSFGTAIPNATVSVIDSTDTVVASGTTDPILGTYSLSAPSSNNYMIKVSGIRGSTGAFVPDTFTLNQPLDLTNDVTANLVPTCQNLTIQLRDSSGNPPVTNLQTRVSSNTTTATFTGPDGVTPEHYGSATTNYATTDGSGDLTVAALSNSNFTDASTGSSGYGYSSATGSGSVGTSDTATTITVPSNRKTISGSIGVNINNATGNINVPNVTVTLNSPDGLHSQTASTDSSGHYSFADAAVSGYTETLNYNGAQNDSYFPGTLSASFSVDLTSNRTGSITLPIASGAVTTLDSLYRPVPFPVKLSTSTSRTQSGFTGAGIITWSLNSNFSDTGSNGGAFHERYFPGLSTPSGTVTASSTVSGSGFSNASSSTWNGTGMTINMPFSMVSISFFTISNGTNPSLSWSYTTHAGDYFNVYRNGVLIGTTTGSTYTDTTITSGGAHNYYYQVAYVPVTTGVESAKSQILLAPFYQ